MVSPTLTARLRAAVDIVRRISRTSFSREMKAHLIRMAGLAKGLYGIARLNSLTCTYGLSSQVWMVTRTWVSLLFCMVPMIRSSLMISLSLCSATVLTVLFSEHDQLQAIFVGER